MTAKHFTSDNIGIHTWLSSQMESPGRQVVAAWSGDGLLVAWTIEVLAFEIVRRGGSIVIKASTLWKDRRNTKNRYY